VAQTLLAVLGIGVTDPSVPVLRADDLGLTRGDGCFEGCRIRDLAVDKLDAHLARMARSAAALEITFDVAAWRSLIREAVAAWPSDGEAAMKLVLTRGPAPGGVPTAFLTIGPLPEDYPRQRRDGVAVVTLDRGTAHDAFAHAPWLLGGVKTLSYAVNMAAQREAERRGADDVIFLSADGQVLEAPTSSVVWSLGRTLHTAPVAGTGILGGTTQQLLFDRARADGWQVAATAASVDDLRAADSLWLVGSVRGPVDVIAIDGVARPRDLGRTAAIRAFCGF
jgi:4-amino-4-deoxychorismate lyase